MDATLKYPVKSWLSLVGFLFASWVKKKEIVVRERCQ